MTWSTKITDLRSTISDGDTDRLRYRKKVFGRQDSINRIFKTFEFRRISDFTVDITGGIGVYKNGVLQTVTTDVVSMGEFTLTTAPGPADEVVATYYAHWFIDSELTGFLNDAGLWIGVGDADSISTGLRPSALDYAAHRSYQKLAIRWAENYSETYRTEDSIDPKRMDIVKAYQEASKSFLDSAKKKRVDFYSRQDQFEAPLFAISSGKVRDVPPRR